MASAREVLVILLLLAAVLHFTAVLASSDFDVDQEKAIVGRRLSFSRPPPPPHINCKVACKKRCLKAGRARRCLDYCQICCRKCNCVPRGTSGHKEECKCYNDLKSSKGRAKCP